MVRDTSKDRIYFFEQIEFTSKVIQRDLQNIESFPRLEGRALMASSVLRNCCENLILRYSRGDAIESIRPAVWQWVEAREIQQRVHAGLPPDLANIRQMYEKLTLDAVYDALTMLAFGAALRFKKDEQARLLAAIGHAGEDTLIDLAARMSGDTRSTISTACKYPRVYQPLLEVWQAEPSQRATLLQACAKDWKKKIKPIYWSNSLNGAEGAYFGYWCFDIALTVMLLEMDDRGLLDNPYYPKDLVQHYRA